MSWNQPDLKILYQFPSRDEYLKMAINLKAGRLSRVKGYRAVTLERKWLAGWLGRYSNLCCAVWVKRMEVVILA